MPRVLAASDQAIELAVQRWRASEVVAFPTETVYGLGADTYNISALRKIYELKGRPANNPLIAHVLNAEQARTIAAQWDERCQILSKSFWPGPLTMVVKKSARVSDEATANLPTIALRSPAHVVARRLLEKFGSPLSAPSANRSGRVSPTSAAHVAVDFADVDDLLIIDGGASEIGIESTVIDVSGAAPRLLRPGSVSVSQLKAVLGEFEVREVSQQGAAPGTSMQHYAPTTPTEMVDSSKLASRLSQERFPCAVLCFDDAEIKPPHVAIGMPRNPIPYAQKLYHALRVADALSVSRILIEAPPSPPPPSHADDDQWRAVRDRLRRATA
jgi:L-threonylcarbamoyladenylate synthase